MTTQPLYTTSAHNHGIRFDLKLIADMVEPGSRVLDIGCGDGALLSWLDRHKQVDARGIDWNMNDVRKAVAQGLSVIQGDADIDLQDYPDQAFDYVILSQTLQATEAPRQVLQQMLRIGKRAIVSFPNFGYWRIRWRLFSTGRMPASKTLPYQWYDTPNIHLCTIKDFVVLCEELGVFCEKGLSLDINGQVQSWDARSSLANIFASQAIFLLARG